jgi:kumamolisin
MRRSAVAVRWAFDAGWSHLSVARLALQFIAIVIGGMVSLVASASARSLPGHVLPARATFGATPYTPTSNIISIAVRLQIQNAADASDLLAHLYSPGDPKYGMYLRPQEFAARFGATPADIDRVTDYFLKIGCTNANQDGSHLQISFDCPQSALETNLGVKIRHWLSPSLGMIRSIDVDPTVPDDLPIQAILGLTNVPLRHPRLVKMPSAIPISPQVQNGTGPGGGRAPSDIKTAYSLRAEDGVSETGSGQTLALVEFDGYTASDISTYASTFSISPEVPLQNILINGFSGTPGEYAGEVTLDIELMMALAPAATKILVYESADPQCVSCVYQQIATDDFANQVSTSWGLPEDSVPSSYVEAEQTIFKQMAMQGQSIFASAGDSGARDDGTNLSVEDPAAQPYVTGVGGTSLTISSDQIYMSESTWSSGGGGISGVWPIPSWQSGLGTTSNLGRRPCVWFQTCLWRRIQTSTRIPSISMETGTTTGARVAGRLCGQPLRLSSTRDG